MNKSLLTVGVAFAALFTTHAFAQKEVEGDRRAAPAAAVQKAEAARATQAAQAGDARPAAAPKNAVKPKKQAAKVKPGTADTKGKKNDIVGPAS